jgi:hypothetical protein
MEDVGIFYGHLVYLTTNWYVSWSFGIYSSVLVSCIKKNLGNRFFVRNIGIGPNTFVKVLPFNQFACFCKYARKYILHGAEKGGLL